MANQHLGFDLFERFKNNTADDDDGCSAEGNIGSEISVKENRNERYDTQTYSTDEDDIVEDHGKVIRGGFSRTDAGIKPPCFFMLFAISIGLKVIEV